MYKCILEFLLSFPLAVEEKPREDIERISARIREFSRECDAADFNIRVDHRHIVRPVGVDLEDIINWLTFSRIYDTEDNEVKSLEYVSKAYFRDLLRYSVLFRIFADRGGIKKYPRFVEKIRKKAKEELEGLEKKWWEMLLS